jgi:predicted small lipoprotein YifL
MEKKLFRFTAAIVILVFAATGCGKSDKDPFYQPVDAFESEIESLEITGEVDDPEVSEVEVDGVLVPVVSGEFSSVVDTAGRSSIEIRATDPASNNATKAIEIK